MSLKDKYSVRNDITSVPKDIFRVTEDIFSVPKDTFCVPNDTHVLQRGIIGVEAVVNDQTARETFIS